MRNLRGYVLFFMVFGIHMLNAQQRFPNQQRDPDQQRPAEQQNPAVRAEATVQKLDDKIKFDKREKDSMLVIFKNFYDEVELYRSEGNKEVLKVLAQKRDQKVKELLSEKKYEMYVATMEEIRAQRQKRMQDGQQNQQRPRRTGGGGMGGMRQPGF
ncbi:MAG: hypothetical protein ACHQK8_08075 [Bacteroidia bacterium]